MFSHRSATLVRRALLLASLLVAVAWLWSSPSAFTTSGMAIVALLAALAWVVQNSYTNGQPAASLAQRIYDSDHGPATPARRRAR